VGGGPSPPVCGGRQAMGAVDGGGREEGNELTRVWEEQ